MNKINTFNEIQLLVKSLRDLRKGFLTNYYPDQSKVELWIAHDLLYCMEFDEAIFLFRKDKHFYHLYYCSTSATNLSDALAKLSQRYKETRFVIDVIGNGTTITEPCNVLESAGFFPYVQLVRMSRTMQETTTMAGANPDLHCARSQDLAEITILLSNYFDPLAENFPLQAEIESWIAAGQVVIFREAETIQGFLIYEITGVTSYLRYWFVHPDHREKKIGSTLINDFFARSSGTKRQLFWVIQSNENAIKRYKHYGFLPESLVDHIYINTNIRYEGKNN
ncbi:MAG: GNAT family N-acetyltransferase [Bacteroidales bacterium]